MKRLLLIFIISCVIVGSIYAFRYFSSNAVYVDFDEFVQQFVDDFDGLSPEEQRELAREGIQVNPADGSLVLHDLGQQGYEVRRGGDFPINELTRLIPIPAFQFHSAMGDENSYFFTFFDITLDQVREYVEQCRNRGFTIDAEERVSELLGEHNFRFTARNSDGNLIEVTHSPHGAMVRISKP
ncbi:MAG: hypothetical protein FWC97_01570 [Treponema sp.]|nr:hypothetical protein [Treponema sp.]